jgi:ribonuclease PH
MDFRNGDRNNDSLRRISIEFGFIDAPLGSVLFKQGSTWVLAAMDILDKVPPHIREGEGGWLTAEYSLLPSSTKPRSQREVLRGKQTGRTVEIQRIIGRALRSVVDLSAVDGKTIVLDCDVLQADGGTRTASITASCLAMASGIHRLMLEEGLPKNPLRDFLVGISVGIVQGEYLLDLSYNEDRMAQVDMNLAITAKGEYVEIQGTAEGKPFGGEDLGRLLNLARKGAEDTVEICRKALEEKGISMPG